MGKSFGLFKIFKKKKKQSNVFLIQKDVKNINEILYKKEKHLKEVELLDKKIILIQKSTQTTVPQLRPLHDSLRQKYKWYYNWHLQPYAKPTHILFLLFYIFSIGLVSNYLVNPLTKIKAQTTYDFPRWEWANPKPTGNSLNKVTTCSDGSTWTIGDSGTILKSTDFGNQWTQEYTGVSSVSSDIICLSPSNIIVIGGTGTIFQYNGISWTQRTSGTNLDLSSITALDTNNIVAVGVSGTITVSTDAGQTWTPKASGAGEFLLSVTALDSMHAVAVGEYGAVTVSSDAGQTWTAKIGVTDKILNKITAIDSTHVVAVGNSGTIIISTDAGQTWNTKVSGTGNTLLNVTALDTNNIVAVGNSGTITVSTDAGQTWMPKVSGTGNALFYVTALDTNNIVAVGVSGTITVSTDAGQTWTPKASGTGNALLNVTALDTNNIVAVGESGTITISTDAGQTWTAKNDGVVDELYQMAVLDTNNIVAVGNSGTITVSTDAGQTWTPKASGTGEFLTSVVALSPNDVVAVGVSGTITVSTDAGQTWTAKVSGTENALFYVTALDTNNIVAVGNSGTITVSTDAGQTWNTKVSGTGNTLLNVTALDTNNIVAVGNSGTITVSTDAGQTWTPKVSGASGVGLSDVGALDTNNIVAVGGSGKITVSTDAGQTWTAKVSGTENALSSITALDTNNIVAVGNSGTITVSTDAGQTWTPKVSGTSNHLVNVIALDSTHVIAVGTNGIITVSSDSGNTWITQSNLTTQRLDSIAVLNTFQQYLVSGWGGIILRYTSPANTTATKLSVQLPGQSFADNTGIFGTSTSVRVGDNVPIYAYAVDGSNKLDRGIAYQVRITSTDPRASNTISFNLNNNLDETCDSGTIARIQNPCGVGLVNYVFHTSGDFTVYAQDTGGSGLTQGVSTSRIHVDPGPIKSAAFENFPSSLGAGAPSGAIAIQAKDLYGNNTTVSSDTTVNLTTNSSHGRFSTNRSTWTSGEKNITIPAGSGSVTFYYLDLATGSPTITAKVGNLSSISSQINITAGELSSSSLTLSRNSIRAGESLTARVNLKNSQGAVLSGKTVRLVSSREGDNTGGDQTTDSDGNASFTVSATKVGSFDLIIYNVSDGLYATVQQTVQVSAGDLSSATLSTNRRTITAGESINLTTTLLDRFGNTVDNSSSLISFSSSDSQTEFKEKNHWFSEGGSYSQDVVFKTAGTQTISALKSDMTLGSTTITVNPASADAGVSDISSDKDRIDPGDEVAAISVRLMDAYGNGIPGKNASITSSRSEDKIKPLSATTGDGGYANFSFSSDIQGESTIVAQDVTDSLILNKKLKIRVMPANILDKIKESPVAKALVDLLAPVSKALALIGLIPLILQILQAIPSAAPLASSVFPALFTTASVRRRKKPWGNVFDSLTGHPVDLAVVRLYEKGTDKLISTQVTDFEGRFHFLAGTGTYYIKVKKKGYEFPAKISKFKASQLSSRFGKDSDIYLGISFTIKNENAQINLNIPIDPVLEKLTNNIRFRKSLKEGFEWFLIIISYIAFPLMLIGAVIAALSTVVISSRVNFVTDGVYIVLLSGFLVTSRIRNNRLGQVFDSQGGKPIIGAMVTVFDQEYNAIRQTQTTDKNGNFSILAQKGTYYIIIEKDGYKFPSTQSHTTKKQPLYTGGIINKPKTGFIGVDIPMDKN